MQTEDLLDQTSANSLTSPNGPFGPEVDANGNLYGGFSEDSWDLDYPIIYGETSPHSDTYVVRIDPLGRVYSANLPKYFIRGTFNDIASARAFGQKIASTDEDSLRQLYAVPL